MKSNHVKGVFFDAGNTLLRVHPSIGFLYSDSAKKFGASISPETIEQSFREHWTSTAPLVDNHGHRLSFKEERDWWKHIVRQVFDRHTEFDDFDAFFDYLYARFCEAESWRLYEDVRITLETLKQNGKTLAIISNWDSRLPELCQQLGLVDYFPTIVVSSLVGYEKPHPAIFEIALRQTDLTAKDVVYVGDDPFLDYNAARQAGMRSLHLDRTHRFPHHPDKIASLRELLDRI